MSLPPTAYAPERRPLASRDHTLAKRATSWLVRHQISPNAISLGGMLAGVAAGGAFALTAEPGWMRVGMLAAAALIQVRLIANLLDGMVAVAAGSASPVGELYNEIPDRISDAAIFVGAGYAFGSSPTLGYLAACFAIFVAYLRAQGKVAGAPQAFDGPQAKQQRAFLMTVAAIVCAILPSSLHQHLAAGQWGPVPGGLLSTTLLLSLLGMMVTSWRRLRRIRRALREAAI